MYTVIGYAGTRAFRVLWLLEEMGLPYRHDRVMPFTEAARARVPGGRLPALELPTGDMLQDSTAILNYLADHHGSLTFPPGTTCRARQDAWVWLAYEHLDVPLMAMALILQRIGPEPAPAVRDRVFGQMATGLQTLDTALAGRAEGPWLMGHRFTVADIVLGHCLHWAERSDQPIAAHPHLRAYLAELQRRPAYRAADSA